ncbi:MAG: waaF, partial [Chloroflexi bacterium]|nr:waaF [Chloroflexota bacterium]
IALVGSMAERELTAGIGQRMRAEARVLAGETSITELAVLLKGAALVVAGDTGPLHLAAALGTPTVGIFGPTDPTNTGPLGPASRVLRLGLPCSPCYDLRSPADCKLPDRSIACMWGIEPPRVLAASLELLDVAVDEPGGISPEAA